MEIRPIRAAEHAALGTLLVEAYAALDGRALGSYLDELADVGHRAQHAVVLVAVEAGEILGGITVVLDPTNPYAEGLSPGEVGIRMLGVSPAAQGQGVGRALMGAALELALEAGADRVALHTTEWMAVAQQLYASMGFQRTVARDLRVDGDLDLLAFVRELGPSVPSAHQPGWRNRQAQRA